MKRREKDVIKLVENTEKKEQIDTIQFVLFHLSSSVFFLLSFNITKRIEHLFVKSYGVE